MGHLTATRSRRGAPRARGNEDITLTPAEDGVDHLITQPIYDQCITAATGRYLAVCGRTIRRAAPRRAAPRLATAAEGSCSLCRVGACT